MANTVGSSTLETILRGCLGQVEWLRLVHSFPSAGQCSLSSLPHLGAHHDLFAPRLWNSYDSIYTALPEDALHVCEELAFPFLTHFLL